MSLMTDLEKHLWGDPQAQSYLVNLVSMHQQNLVKLNSPAGDRYREIFERYIMPIITAPVIDGGAVFDLLLKTGGADYALDLYRAFPGYITRAGALPDFRDVAEELSNMPPLSPEIIGGILRRGHQMLIAGGSKTSKSFLVLELAVAVALGQDWLKTFPCQQGRVLYVNGEIDRASCDRRIAAILERLGIDREDLRGKMAVASLRGVSFTIDQLCERINESGGFDMVVLDPIYTLGDVTDENNAAAVRGFLREIGKLSTETGAAVVAVHHHGKGAQGNKRSIDRASGSGVFSRWFDGIVDLSLLHIPDSGVAEQSRTPESVPMRLEFDLRDFRDPKPLSLWWHYPIHIPDASGELDGLLVDGDPRGNLVQYQSGQSKEQRQAQRDANMTRAINAIKADGREPTVQAVADELSVTDRTIREWLDNSSAIVKNGKILETENRK